MMNKIAWLLSAPMLPLFKSILNHGVMTPETDRVVAIYGYLTAYGVIFNCVALVVFVVEVLL